MNESSPTDRGTVAAVDAAALERDALAALAAAATADDVEHVRVEYLGRKSALKLALREVRDRETGMTLNAASRALEAAIDAREARARRAELDRRLTEERVDVTLPGDAASAAGTCTSITQIRREVEDIFLGLGYTVVDGREVETTRYNFDALNFPPGHPTRSPRPDALPRRRDACSAPRRRPSQIQDDGGAGSRPIYIVSLGPRATGATPPTRRTTPTFHQVEGLAVDEGITLADLQGTLDYLLQALFGEDRETDFRTHYFPFTEPSIEAYVSCHVCDGLGLPRLPALRAGSRSAAPGWSTRTSSSSSATTRSGTPASRSAGGSSASRMLRHGIPDLRELWRNDPRSSRQF